MADLIETTTTSITKVEAPKVLTPIQTGSQIALYPLYGGTYEKDGLVLPVSPSGLMFNEDSDAETIKLLNYGEMPVAMNRRLANWSIESFFPAKANSIAAYSASNGRGTVDNNKQFKYWFDVSDGTKDPYEHYCKILYDWKKNQTPLVFFFKTWNGYYNCQIKRFSFGRKDAIGNVYYSLEFQEYKEYIKTDIGQATTDYSGDTYTPADGENILQICRKIYGSSDYYTYFMKLNDMLNTKIEVGRAYKVR